MKPTDKQITDEMREAAAAIIDADLRQALRDFDVSEDAIKGDAELGDAARATASAALEAALSAQDGAVGVKALDWEPPDGPDGDAWLGHGTDMCQYYLRREGGCWWLPGNSDDAEDFATLEEAKAAAQADYERRIRSALTSPSPAQEAEPWPIKILDEQTAYNLGYQNPSLPSRRFKWQHLVFVNAYICGQLDHQNTHPRNRDYRREQYDPETFERLPETVEFYDRPVSSPAQEERAEKQCDEWPDCACGRGGPDNCSPPQEAGAEPVAYRWRYKGEDKWRLTKTTSWIYDRSEKDEIEFEALGILTSTPLDRGDEWEPSARLDEIDRLLRSSVPEPFKSATSPVGAVQGYIAELESRLRAAAKGDGQ